MTRSPFVVPVLLSVALSEVIVRTGRSVTRIDAGGRCQDRDAIRRAAAGGRMTASLMTSLPSPRVNE